MTIEEVIGSKIREAREELGWTQAQLGIHLLAILGDAWSPQAISAAEKGRRDFRAVDLFALHWALNRPVEWFYSVPTGTEIEFPGSVVTVGTIEEPDKIAIAPKEAGPTMALIREWYGEKPK